MAPNDEGNAEVGGRALRAKWALSETHKKADSLVWCPPVCNNGRDGTRCDIDMTAQLAQLGALSVAFFKNVT